MAFQREEGEKPKKWVVYIVLIVGVVGMFCLLYGIYAVTETMLHENEDDSLPNVDRFYAFYDLEIGKEETPVYFIGSSMTCFSIDSRLIDAELKSRGSDITAYSLFLEADTPRLRAIQMEAIADSLPALVIYGVTYRTLTDTKIGDVFRKRLLASLKHTPLTLELRSFYTDKELFDLNYGAFYQKGYVLNNIKKLLLKTNDTNGSTDKSEKISRETAINYAKDSYVSFVKQKSAEPKNMDSVRKSAKNVNSEWRPEVPSDKTLNKQALLYNLRILKEHNIPFVLIKMPMSPTLSVEISEEARNNFDAFFAENGLTYIDMEDLYDDDHFYDIIHSTYDGMQDFSMKMVDLIIDLEGQNVIHHT